MNIKTALINSFRNWNEIHDFTNEGNRKKYIEQFQNIVGCFPSIRIQTRYLVYTE